MLFETIAKINARKNLETPEELRRENMRLLLENAVLQKANLFGFTLRDGFLRDGNEGEMRAYLGQDIKKVRK